MKAELKYGIILGVAISCWMMIAHVLGFYTTNLQAGSYADMAITILPIVFLFLAILARRRRQGSLTLLQGITTGMVAILISYVISGTFLWIYQHYINPNWLDYVIAFQQSKMTQAGAAASEVNAVADRLRSRNTAMAQFIGGLIGTLVLGFILSLIFSVILRKKP